LLLLTRISSFEASIPHLLLELAGGVAIGVAIPWLALKIESTPLFAVSTAYTPLLPVSIALLVLSSCWITGANEFLAAFSAGICTAHFGSATVEEFHGIGETVTELLKLAALMVFGAVFSLWHLRNISWQGCLFAVLAITAIRPIALGVSLIGRFLPWREFVTAAWFGPKGFASVTYALITLEARATSSDLIFRLAALVVGLSIIAHSSTDVPIAKWLVKRSEGPDAGFPSQAN
jgi:NhaP-type Na+/H+ or K+/H+ antiporter